MSSAGAGISCDRRLHAVEMGCVAATHHRQSAVLGARLSARDGRIDETEPQCGGACVKFSRHICRSGRVINEDCALFHAGEGSVGPKRDGAKVVVISDAGEHNFGVGRGFARRRKGLHAVFRREALRLLDRPIIDGEAMPAPRQMASHGVAHDAKSKIGDAQAWRAHSQLLYANIRDSAETMRLNRQSCSCVG